MRAQWRLVTAVVVAMLGVSACTSDERWEGKLKACSTDAFNNNQVLLILDTPRPPEPTGLFGVADEDNEKTWSVTEIEDASGPVSGITFTAEFNNGSLGSQTWKVELSGGPTSMDGTADIDISLGVFGTTNVKCDVEVKREG